MRDQFGHFYALDEGTEKTAIQTGLVTPDTNVLLNLYRFQARARNELFGALEKLGERLWIPHQVGLEFHRRRLDVIAEQEKYFKNTQKDLDALIGGLRKRVEIFRTRIALDKDRVREVKESIGLLQKLLIAEVNDAQTANEVRLRDRDSDAVLARLEFLLGNRVGEPMRPKVLRAARKEAKRRVVARLPPGYGDSGKADPTGDYLIFRQLMDEAKERKLPVVFITDDEKPDWYRREHGIPLGARHELREEMMAEAGVPFVIMTTEKFLRSAEKYLNAEVSPETVDQAKELPSIFEDDLRSWLERYLAIYPSHGILQARRALDSYAAAVASLPDEARSEVDRAILAAFRPQPGEMTDREQAEQKWITYLALHGQASEEQPSPEEDEQE